MRKVLMLAAVAGTALFGAGAKAAPMTTPEPALAPVPHVQTVDWDHGGDEWRYRESRRHEEWEHWRRHEAWERWHRWHEAQERARYYGW